MDDSTRQLPTLAPGPRGAGALSALAVSRPKKNSTACLACKQAKRKCSGRPPPCKACEGTDSECIFDESLDLRRKVAMKRTVDELEGYKELLYSLLDTLRSADPATVDRLLTVIRSNASLSDIAAAVSEHIRELRSKVAPGSDPSSSLEEAASKAEQLQHVPGAYSRRRFMMLENLCDIPLFNVPAKPWTNVTDDTQFVSHLVSLYFTWNHPFSQFIDQQTFLHHMISGDLESQFCSPFLVNSLLAVASIYCDFPEAFASPADSSSRGEHFHAEAERLWKAEEGKVTLSNIQGLLLMVLAENYRGKDEVGWLMFRQAMSLAQDLGLFPAPPRVMISNQDALSAEMRRSRALCAWGMFVLNSQITVTRRSVADLDLPAAKPYTRNDLEDGITWTPYPRSNRIDYAKKPALLRYLMVEMVDLAEILAEIQDLVFNKASGMLADDLWKHANILHNRLQQWYDRLPEALSISDCPVPQALFLRMHYHWIVLTLFNVFEEREQLLKTVPSSHAEHAKTIRLQSAKEIARYSRIQRQTYGLTHVPCDMLLSTSAGLFVLLDTLGNTESQTAFIELSRLPAALSQRSKLSRGVLRMLERTAQQSNIVLPSDVLTIFTDYDKDTSYEVHNPGVSGTYPSQDIVFQDSR